MASHVISWETVLQNNHTRKQNTHHKLLPNRIYSMTDEKKEKLFEIGFN